MKVLHALAVLSVAVSSAFARVLREPAARRLSSPGASRAGARASGPPPLGPNGTRDPFPKPIPAEDGAITVDFVEFAVDARHRQEMPRG